MSILKCQSCGAPLMVEGGQSYAICEYCGSQTILNQSKDKFYVTDKHAGIQRQGPNGVFISIPSCGSLAFQKKTFNVYKDHAELVDEKTGAVEQHIVFSNVMKFQQMLGMSMIIFKMSDGQRIFIKCIYEGKTSEVMNVLNGLIKPSK